MDGNLANAGAAEGGPMEGADRRGESCQSQVKDLIRYQVFIFLTVINLKS